MNFAQVSSHVVECYRGLYSLPWTFVSLARASGEAAFNVSRLIGHARSTIVDTTLYRPVGPKEYELIAASGWREFPPRLPDQPIFYPVTNEPYAIQIARNWNVKASGAGFVTKFQVDAYYLSRYRVEKVGGAIHTESEI